MIKKENSHEVLHVFTRRKPFNELKNYGKVYCLTSGRVKNQFQEVLDHLKAVVPKENVLSRCLVSEISKRKKMKLWNV